jgi:uncharacterized RDD family membrane protein YckC
MNEVERYIREVLRNISAPPQERQRIEADLRAHLEESLATGEPAKEIIARMGSPTEIATVFMAQVSLRYAGFWWRLAAYGIDLAIIFVVASILAILAIVLVSFVPRSPVGLDWIVGGALLALLVSAVLGIIGVIVLYFPILEARFGQTAGKHLLSLRVLKENGLPIGYKEAFLRRLSFYFRMLPVDALFIPFTAKRQRAFDLVARTIVIREREGKK